VDDNAVSRTEVIVDLFLVSWNEPAGLYAQVGTRVEQQLPYSNTVGDEKVAWSCSADMCRC
jgi:hypothetical protein